MPRRAEMLRVLRCLAWLTAIALLWPILLVHGLGAVPLMALVLGAILLSRRSEPPAALFEVPAPPAMAASTLPFWIGLLLLACALAGLEVWQPQYFVQDDNYAQFLPIIVQASRSFFAGTFPTWNAHQLLGQPTTTVGVYALTYPPTYLCSAAARHVIGNDAWTLDVFCIGHLLAGYVVLARWLQRDLGVRGWLAAQAALGFALSGFFLVGGRSWFYMVPLALWLPLIFQAFFRTLAEPSGRNAALLGAAIGLLFHAGNAQMWLYTLLFLGCAALLFFCSGAVRRAHVLALVGALCVGLLTALPLLVSQLDFTADVSRASWGSGTVRGIFALGLPHPFVTAAGPNDWGGSDAKRMTAFYYCGLISSAAALALALAWWRRLLHVPFERRQLASPVVLCILLSAACLEVSYGSEGFGWPVLSRLPVLSKFTNPFKFIGFLSFFVAVLGAVYLEHALPKGPPPQRDRRAMAVMALAVVLLALHVPQTRVAFWTYADAVDRRLPQKLQALMPADQRVASVTPLRSGLAGHSDTLPNNLATLQGVLHIDGYDPLVEAKPETRVRRDPATWRDFGVATVLVAPGIDARQLVQQHGLVHLLDLPTVRVFRVPEPRPLAFSPDGAVEVQGWRISGHGLDIDVRPMLPQGRLTVGFLWRRGMHAWVQDTHGQRREVTVGQDALHRIVLALPPGTRVISLVYQPWWRFGAGLVLLLAVLLLAVLRAARRPSMASRWKRTRTVLAADGGIVLDSSPLPGRLHDVDFQECAPDRPSTG